MAQIPFRDSLADLERHRLLLEENVEKLRKALQHWQTWEAEYEAFKEEIQELHPDATGKDLIEAGKSLSGELVTEKEVKELLGVDKGIERTGKQITELLSRRIEYVQRNVASMQKQVDSALFKLEQIEVVSQPEMRNEDGLPITEIYEELDEEGNVISSSTTHPDEVRPQILEALKRVGLKEEDIGSAAPSSSRLVAEASDAAQKSKASELLQATQVSQTQPPGKNTRERIPGGTQKKSVAFAEGTKEEASEPAVDHSTSHATGEGNQKRTLSDLARGSFASTEKVIELDENDMPVNSIMPQAPIDESPEDAALRRQMQAYGMQEVGEIVAQLDLEEVENDSQSSFDDHTYDSEHNDFDVTASSDDDEGEDQYGMNTNGQLSEKYKKEMLELEQRLNARMLQNVGPNPSFEGESDLAADARKLVIQREKPVDEMDKVEQGDEMKFKDKSVRFAEALDIAPSLQVPSVAEAPQGDLPTPNIAVKDMVAECNPSKIYGSNQAPAVSRFKMARQAAKSAQDSDEITKPHRSTTNPLAADIIERTPKAQNAPPDEFHPDTVRRELNSEYYRQRNRIIQRQGGFKRSMQDEEESEADDDDEDEASAPKKKVSLFKAARAQTGGSW